MRIWSLHPEYLDVKGLVALWRETLLAKKVLQGGTKGYTNHPQLARFKVAYNPLAAIDVYLAAIYGEATQRGYRFDCSKFDFHARHGALPVATGQIAFEVEHLLKKLKIRDYQRYLVLKSASQVVLHPLFTQVPGGVEPWEVQ